MSKRGRVELESQVVGEKNKERKSGEATETKSEWKEAREKRKRSEGKKSKTGPVLRWVKGSELLNRQLSVPRLCAPWPATWSVECRFSNHSAESRYLVELVHTTLPSWSLKLYPGRLDPIDRVMDLRRSGCHAAF